MIKPAKLKCGDTIGVIAPAGPVYDEKKIDRGVEELRSYGFNVILSENCYLKHGYLAGPDETRASDINKFFGSSEIDGIICLRGGYGCGRILDMIDYKVIENNPKVFIGYSDITALHSAIHKRSNLVTFHGPMVASDLAKINPFNSSSLLDCISGNLEGKRIELIPINKGNIYGKIVGGNLCIVCSLLGTKYEEDFNDKILFIEDIGEEPYRIDRMLHQLKHSKVLDKVKGVILGQFTNCKAQDENESLSFRYVIEDFFSRINLPVFEGFPAGHDESKITIPLGTEIAIQDNSLFFAEEGVE